MIRDYKYKKDATSFADHCPEEVTIVANKKAGPLKNALSNLKTYIEKILAHPKCTSYEVFIGGKGNFRLDIDPTYKMDRDPMSKPIHLDAMKDYLCKHYNATRCNGMEADDVVSYRCQEDLENNCIVSVDKDLRNTSGWHYNPDKEILDYVTESEADLNFYRQLLMGDSTDGIVGIAGYGVAAAKRILPESLPVEEMYYTVWTEYQDKGYDYDYFFQQAGLLWMLRDEFLGWTPPIVLNNRAVMPEVIEMPRMIVRNKETGESIGSRPININKIPSTYQLRTKMLKDLAHLIACESKIEGEFNELRYVLISHSNRAVFEGDL